MRTLLALALTVAAFSAPLATAQSSLTGIVTDPSGAAVPNATVSVIRSGRAMASTVTTTSGEFRLDGLATGRCELTIETAGSFAPFRRQLRVDVTNSLLHFQLALPKMEDSVVVTAGEDTTPSVETSANLDKTRVSAQQLDELPILDDDYLGALTQFLDPASIATGGTVITVDGMEVSRATVPKSAVQQISINDDPYSAASNRPGHGRIDVITKPGSGSLRGSLDYSFRNSALASRGYFSPVKAAERREAVEAFLSGPVGKGQKTSFTLSFSDRVDDAAAVVHAITPAGAFDTNVSRPSRNSELMARLSRDWTDSERSSLQLNWERRSDLLSNVGGVVLPGAGVDNRSREFDLFFNLESTLTPTLLNRFQFTIEVNREPAISVSNAQAIVVRDAFVGGGAQATVLRTESGGKINDIVTRAFGRQIISGGIQIPNLNRRVYDDRTNEGGTFSFATIADYEAGHPYAYNVQQGTTRVAFWWREYGAFVEDQIDVSKSFHATVGLRYDWQAFFHDNNNFAPRGSFAWKPGKDGTLVVRGGAGVFYDRSGVGPVAALLLHDGRTLRSYTILNPSYPDPLAGGVTLTNLPTDVTRLAPNVQLPYTVQFGASAERALSKSLSVVLGYRGSRGHHLFRSVDINAPLAPDFTTVPDPRYGRIQEIRSDGRLQSDALELTVRGRAGKRLNGQLQYTLASARNDTGGIFWYPSNQYAPAEAEWGPADFDVRHRLNALATLNAGNWGKLGASLKYASALPYTLTAGEDLFRTGFSNARPDGVARNTLRASPFETLDVRWSHDIPAVGLNVKKGTTLSAALAAFNVLNHTNFSGYVGNLRSPFYLLPTNASSGRRIQLSLELQFGEE